MPGTCAMLLSQHLRMDGHMERRECLRPSSIITSQSIEGHCTHRLRNCGHINYDKFMVLQHPCFPMPVSADRKPASQKRQSEQRRIR